MIADLERSGLFRIIPEDSYIQTFTSIDELPRFTDWKALNAAALIQSAISEIDAANLRVEFRLWDVYSEEQMKGQSFTTTKDNWRRVAHVIADAVYERLTGEKGYFDTRIVYISESGPATAASNGLASDQDGEIQVSDPTAPPWPSPRVFRPTCKNHLSVLCRRHAESLYARHRNRRAETGRRI